MVSTEVKILDYSNSQIITWNSGLAKLQTGTFKLIHIIETNEYQKLITTLEDTLRHDVNPSHFLQPLLNREITELQSYLDRIKPRSKRSLDFLGSAWKWIAGSPDHDDLEILTKKTNKILRNNNKQVVINKLTIGKINELTRITNDILESVNNGHNKNNSLKEQLGTLLKYKLDTVKEELTNIQHAMHWAKVGVVNSFLLTSEEINIVKEIINNDSIPFVNLEQAFEFAEIKIASNHDSIIYILSIPTTQINSCSKLLVRPIKIGKYVNKIKYNNILICDNVMYGVKNACKSYNNITICNRNNLDNLESDMCLANLIKSKAANCSLIDNKNTPTLEEISPGTILLNQFNGTILINEEPQKLNGTYVIQFCNTTVTIGNKNYNFFETTQVQTLPAILQPRYLNQSIEETLTLEMVKEIRTNNTEAIDLLDDKHTKGLAVNLGFSLMTISTIVILLIKSKLLKRNSKAVIVPTTINAIPTVHTSMPELSDTGKPEKRGITRISNIPYF